MEAHACLINVNGIGLVCFYMVKLNKMEQKKNKAQILPGESKLTFCLDCSLCQINKRYNQLYKEGNQNDPFPQQKNWLKHFF